MMQTTVEQATTITRQGDRGKLYFYGDIVSSWWGAWDNTDQYPERIRDAAQGKISTEIRRFPNIQEKLFFFSMACPSCAR